MIEEAKKILKDKGYFVDNLWHVDDVKEMYNCTDEQAQMVLNNALTSDSTMEQIWFAIEMEANMKSLNKTTMIVTSREVTRDVLENVFVTAIEGGSNYWYYIPKKSVTLIRDVVPKSVEPCISVALFKAVFDHNVDVAIHDIEDKEKELGVISLKTMQERIQKLADTEPNYFDIEVDECGDAVSSDVWFQYIILGELIFG